MNKIHSFECLLFKEQLMASIEVTGLLTVACY